MAVAHILVQCVRPEGGQAAAWLPVTSWEVSACPGEVTLTSAWMGSPAVAPSIWAALHTPLPKSSSSAAKGAPKGGSAKDAMLGRVLSVSESRAAALDEERRAQPLTTWRMSLAGAFLLHGAAAVRHFVEDNDSALFTYLVSTTTASCCMLAIVPSAATAAAAGHHAQVFIVQVDTPDKLETMERAIAEGCIQSPASTTSLLPTLASPSSAPPLTSSSSAPSPAFSAAGPIAMVPPTAAAAAAATAASSVVAPPAALVSSTPRANTPAGTPSAGTSAAGMTPSHLTLPAAAAAAALVTPSQQHPPLALPAVSSVPAMPTAPAADAATPVRASPAGTEAPARPASNASRAPLPPTSSPNARVPSRTDVGNSRDLPRAASRSPSPPPKPPLLPRIEDGAWPPNFVLPPVLLRSLRRLRSSPYVLLSQPALAWRLLTYAAHVLDKHTTAQRIARTRTHSTQVTAPTPTPDTPLGANSASSADTVGRSGVAGVPDAAANSSRGALTPARATSAPDALANVSPSIHPVPQSSAANNSKPGSNRTLDMSSGGAGTSASAGDAQKASGGRPASAATGSGASASHASRLEPDVYSEYVRRQHWVAIAGRYFTPLCDRYTAGFVFDELVADSEPVRLRHVQADMSPRLGAEPTGIAFGGSATHATGTASAAAASGELVLMSLVSRTEKVLRYEKFERYVAKLARPLLHPPAVWNILREALGLDPRELVVRVEEYVDMAVTVQLCVAYSPQQLGNFLLRYHAGASSSARAALHSAEASARHVFGDVDTADVELLSVQDVCKLPLPLPDSLLDAARVATVGMAPQGSVPSQSTSSASTDSASAPALRRSSSTASLPGGAASPAGGVAPVPTGGGTPQVQSSAGGLSAPPAATPTGVGSPRLSLSSVLQRKSKHVDPEVDEDTLPGAITRPIPPELFMHWGRHLRDFVAARDEAELRRRKAEYYDSDSTLCSSDEEEEEVLGMRPPRTARPHRRGSDAGAARRSSGPTTSLERPPSGAAGADHGRPFGAPLRMRAPSDGGDAWTGSGAQPGRSGGTSARSARLSTTSAVVSDRSLPRARGDTVGGASVPDEDLDINEAAALMVHVHDPAARHLVASRRFGPAAVDELQANPAAAGSLDMEDDDGLEDMLNEVERGGRRLRGARGLQLSTGGTADDDEDEGEEEEEEGDGLLDVSDDGSDGVNAAGSDEDSDGHEAGRLAGALRAHRRRGTAAVRAGGHTKKLSLSAKLQATAANLAEHAFATSGSEDTSSLMTGADRMAVAAAVMAPQEQGVNPRQDATTGPRRSRMSFAASAAKFLSRGRTSLFGTSAGSEGGSAHDATRGTAADGQEAVLGGRVRSATSAGTVSDAAAGSVRAAADGGATGAPVAVGGAHMSREAAVCAALGLHPQILSEMMTVGSAEVRLKGKLILTDRNLYFQCNNRLEVLVVPWSSIGKLEHCRTYVKTLGMELGRTSDNGLFVSGCQVRRICVDSEAEPQPTLLGSMFHIASAFKRTSALTHLSRARTTVDGVPAAVATVAPLLPTFPVLCNVTAKPSLTLQFSKVKDLLLGRGQERTGGRRQVVREAMDELIAAHVSSTPLEQRLRDVAAAARDAKSLLAVADAAAQTQASTSGTSAGGVQPPAAEVWCVAAAGTKLFAAALQAATHVFNRLPALPLHYLDAIRVVRHAPPPPPPSSPPAEVCALLLPGSDAAGTNGGGSGSNASISAGVWTLLNRPSVTQLVARARVPAATVLACQEPLAPESVSPWLLYVASGSLTMTAFRSLPLNTRAWLTHLRRDRAEGLSFPRRLQLYAAVNLIRTRALLKATGRTTRNLLVCSNCRLEPAKLASSASILHRYMLVDDPRWLLRLSGWMAHEQEVRRQRYEALQVFNRRVSKLEYDALMDYVVFPIMTMRNSLLYIYAWETPALSLSVYLLVLATAWRDQLSYAIPLGLLFHAMFILAWGALDAPSRQRLHFLFSRPRTASGKGLLSTLFRFREQLGRMQLRMHNMSVIGLKIRSLYTWRDPNRTRLYVGILFLSALIITVLSLRWVVILFCLLQLTKPFRPRKNGVATVAWRRFWSGLPVPLPSDPVYAPIRTLPVVSLQAARDAASPAGGGGGSSSGGGGGGGGGGAHARVGFRSDAAEWVDGDFNFDSSWPAWRMQAI